MTDCRSKIATWPGPQPASRATVRSQLDSQRSNGPGEVYPAHTYPYHKVIYVVHGCITLALPGHDRSLVAHTGARLNPPAQVARSAVMGAAGVICLEAHLP